MPHPLPDDPEVLHFIAETNAFYPDNAADASVEQNRIWYDRYSAAFRKPRPCDVKVTEFAISAVPARRYDPAAAQPSRVVLYLHGGGFVLGGLDSHDDICAELASRAGCAVVAIAYRLAPEHLHPAQLDDSEAAFRHLAAEAKVVVGGDSAGASLAAALCLRCRGAGGVMPIGQFLIYPGLGGRSDRGSYISRAAAPMLTAEQAAAYFRLLTGGAAPAAPDPELEPLKAESFRGLPPAVIVSADIDPLRDDGAEYAGLLGRDGVRVCYRNEPELVHGYLRARHMSRRAAASFGWIVAGVSDLVAGQGS